MIKRRYERFNETLYIIKLKNGMQVHLLPKDDPYFTTYVELSIPYGALHLKYKVDNQIYQTPYGMAHFLEHQIFAMPDGDAFTKFSMLGTDANAMTSYQQTSYLFVATEHVKEALDHLLDMVDTPYFIPDRVEQEKQIITEELKMYLDDPVMQMQNDLLENMYYKHPIRFDIGGTVDSIIAIDAPLLQRTYEHFYHPNNRLIVIAGKMDVKMLESYFRAYDQKYPNIYEVPKLILPRENKYIQMAYQEKTKDLSMDKLMLGIKLVPKKMTKSKRLIKELAVSMLLNMALGASSVMYSQLLEDELINHSFYITSNVEKNAENIIIYGESKQVDRLKDALLELLTKNLSVVVDEESFERFKKVFMGQFIYALNHLDTKAYLYGKYYHMKTSLFDVVDLLKDIYYEDVKLVLNDFIPENISVLIYRKK